MSNINFFAYSVLPGKCGKHIPIEDCVLHITKAALSKPVKDDEMIPVYVSVCPYDDEEEEEKTNDGDLKKFCICTLSRSKMQCSLQLKFGSSDLVYFSTDGNTAVHLTGFYEVGDADDEELEEEYLKILEAPAEDINFAPVSELDRLVKDYDSDEDKDFNPEEDPEVLPEGEKRVKDKKNYEELNKKMPVDTNYESGEDEDFVPEEENEVIKKIQEAAKKMEDKKTEEKKEEEKKIAEKKKQAFKKPNPLKRKRKEDDSKTVHPPKKRKKNKKVHGTPNNKPQKAKFKTPNSKNSQKKTKFTPKSNKKKFKKTPMSNKKKAKKKFVKK